MKIFNRLSIVLGLVLTMLPAYNAIADQQILRPILVELFTSEGCSDCPPADSVLMQLAFGQPVRGARIIALEEHVNYWNNPQHWVDPFSSTQVTNRQYDYSSYFNDDSPYTPEMVVDGAAHFVGSNSGAAISAVRSAINNQAAYVTLSLSTVKNGATDVSVTISNIPPFLKSKKVAVLIAVTQDGYISRITGGENRGRTLAHSSVTRSLGFLGYLSTGSANSYSTNVSLPTDYVQHPLHIIVFVQDTETKRVYGVNECSL